ncbi:hypothetical protein [Halalkalibacter urbisdiaboli]|uniref:hypothetical protein n=1 Tax=Halalkalibacter urbisdiaboli TaxID=1960589 RepID=UPI000B43B683|nr:hypothetical protein [Halalkalibacter urbisdiaboli]
MKEDKTIPFPSRNMNLSEDEYRLFLDYREKILNATSQSEVEFYFSLALNLIHKAKNRYH